MGGTHTVQFDNVLKSKHRLSVKNRELPLNSMQGREGLNGTHYIQRHYIAFVFWPCKYLGTGTAAFTVSRINVYYFSIHDQHLRSMGIPGSGSRDSLIKKCNISGLKNHINPKLQYVYRWSLGLPKGRPSYRRNLQPSKENILHFIFFCCLSFLSTWIRIRIQPTKINAYPDPQHWFILSMFARAGGTSLNKKSQTGSQAMFEQTPCPILQQTRRYL